MIAIPPAPVAASQLPPYSIKKDDPITAIAPTPTLPKAVKKPHQDAKTKLHKAERHFDELLDDIFEADDLLAGDTSTNSSKVDPNKHVYWFPLSRSATEPCLANPILINLEDSLRKIKTSKYFLSTLEFDRILNLYKLLERSISHADTAIGSTSDPLDGEVEEIEQVVLTCDNAVKAIKVLFQIFFSGRPEKNLIPEDLLNNITSLVSKILENHILPISNLELGSHPVMRLRGVYSGFCQEIIQLIDILSVFSATANLNEASVTKLEFLSIKIIFYESTAKPRDSLLGATNIESLRVSSMRLTSILYGTYADQRSFILDEILSSFAKLPVNKTARQFRLANGVTIQLVSALVMRLVQTCGSMEFEFLDSRQADGEAGEKLKARRAELAVISTKAINESSNSAAEVINYLLSRAMKTTKSGDSPFRSLIDLFMEDFSVVLPNPEWPAAELVMSTLAASLTTLLDNDKDGVQVSTMALELLGSIIAKLWHFKESEDKMIDLSANTSIITFNEFTDSAHTVLLYLQNLTGKDITMQISYRYFLTLYASILSQLSEAAEGELKSEVIKKLDEIIVNGKEGSWLDYGKDELHADMSPKEHALEAYDRFLYSRSLSRYYGRILTAILRSLNHSKINMRTKSLRIVAQLLAQNPEIFSLPQVQTSLSERLIDNSSQVRDAAVDIVGKYIVLKPQFAKDFYLIICDRSSDTGLVVRKRVVKLLKEIYNAVDDAEIKIEIADRLVRRVEDEEPSISELAVGILTDFFFGPLALGGSNAADIQYQYSRNRATGTIMNILEATWKRGDKVARLLGQFFVKLFHPIKGTGSATAQATAKILVEELTERASQEQDAGTLDKLLGLLSELVNANGSFVTQNQLTLLIGFIVDESANSTPLACYYVLLIFKKSLNNVGPLRPQFLQDLQGALLRRLSKFNIREQSEAIPCLWKVLVMRKDTKKIATVGLSCLRAIEPYVKAANNKSLTTNDPKLIKLSHLLGNIGRHCDVTENLEIFAAVQTKKPATSLAELIIRKELVFCESHLPLTIQKVAIRTICNICITHPLMFLSKAVLKVLDVIMNGDDHDLREQAMKMMIDFLFFEEDTANATAALRSGKTSEEVDLGVFHGVTNKFVNDGASASLMQRYLPKIIEFATSGETDFALTATLLLERIIRQGFANPRIAVATIIALETSHHKDISTVAKGMHAKLHDKHESMIEGSYVEGVRAAANYRARLSSNIYEEYDNFSYFYHFMKNNRASKRKFLLGVTKTLDFKSTGNDQVLDSHVQYLAFVSNSLSTLPFYTQEEVYTTIYGLDKIVSGTGVHITHLIEMAIEEPDENKTASDSAVPSATTEASTKKSNWPQLSRCAVLVHMVWCLRTFLRTVYNISEVKSREFNPSKPGKDTKPISRASGHINDVLELSKKLDLTTSYDNDENGAVSSANLARAQAFLKQVSPEALNPEEFQVDDGGSEGMTSFVSSNGQASTSMMSNHSYGSSTMSANVSMKEATPRSSIAPPSNRKSVVSPNVSMKAEVPVQNHGASNGYRLPQYSQNPQSPQNPQHLQHPQNSQAPQHLQHPQHSQHPTHSHSPHLQHPQHSQHLQHLQNPHHQYDTGSRTGTPGTPSSTKPQPSSLKRAPSPAKKRRHEMFNLQANKRPRQD